MQYLLDTRICRYLILLIAGLARSLDMTLVTNNSKEFERIDGLNIENWAE
jgi:tRNA(fMet)-specific endonuclease VapC